MSFSLITQNHLDKCEFTVANCENFSKGCTELVRLSDMKEHLRDQCKYRDDVCQYCQRVLPKAEMEVRVFCGGTIFVILLFNMVKETRKNQKNHSTHSLLSSAEVVNRCSTGSLSVRTK